MRPNPETIQDLREYPILYVDDEEENLRIFDLTFRRQFGIYTATSGEEGLDILNTKPVALVLSDHRMPGMTGTEFLSRVAEIDPKTIRIMVTAYGDAETLEDAINNGSIYHFIPKPWNPDDVRATLIRGIQAYALDRERAQLLQELTVVNRVSAALNRELDTTRLIDLFTRTLRNDLGYDGASLMLWDAGERTLFWAQTASAQEEIDRKLASVRFTPENAREFVEELEDGRSLTLKSEDVLDYSAAVREWVIEVAAEEILVTPLFGKRGLIGAITVDNRRGGGRFKVEDVTLIEGLSNQAAIALENARLVEDLRASRDQLRRVDRLGALGTLASGIAEDLDAPLDALGAFLSEAPAKREADDTASWDERCSEMRDEIERVRNLVVTMQRLGEAGAAHGPRETVDVCEVVSGVIGLVGREAELGHVDLRLHAAADTPKIVAARDALHQVVLNLVLNALGASPAGSRVDIRVCAAEGDGVQLEVTDAGPGFTPEQLDEIFDPFSAAHGSGGEESGLGLMVCQRIVTEHGGSIEVRSGEGPGATFQVRLPRDADPSTA